MRLLFKLLFFTIVLSPLLIGALLYLALETNPTVANRTPDITPASMERAKRIITQNDPRKLPSGARRTVSTNAVDLDLAANYLAHQFGHGSTRVKLHSDGARLTASHRLPLIPTPLYVNIDAALIEFDTSVRVESLSIGRVVVPGWLVHWAIPRLLANGFPKVDFRALGNAVKKVDLSDTQLTVTYEWQAQLADSLRALAIPPEEQQRLRLYQDRLVTLSQAVKAKNLSMTELLMALFRLADERSDAGTAALENRSALFVLIIYINGRTLDNLIPEAKSWPRPVKHGVLLSGRDDLPKHFVISAALAANAGGPLADAVGLYKEVEDSRGGSGFSFNDIAADRAGAKFGEYAVHRDGARILQKKIGAGVNERDIMPATADLPEFMKDAEFQRRFGGVNGAEYKKMMAEIERRIAALPLYR
jgi:hypothetical protein